MPVPAERPDGRESRCRSRCRESAGAAARPDRTRAGAAAWGVPGVQGSRRRTRAAERTRMAPRLTHHRSPEAVAPSQGAGAEQGRPPKPVAPHRMVPVVPREEAVAGWRPLEEAGSCSGVAERILLRAAAEERDRSAEGAEEQHHRVEAAAERGRWAEEVGRCPTARVVAVSSRWPGVAVRRLRPSVAETPMWMEGLAAERRWRPGSVTQWKGVSHTPCRTWRWVRSQPHIRDRSSGSKPLASYSGGRSVGEHVPARDR